MVRGGEFVQAATFKEHAYSDTAKIPEIKKGYRLVLCRKATSEEIALLVNYHKKQLLHFRNSPEQAEQFVTIGEYSMDETKNKIELAALMQIVHTMYNLEEAITKT